MEKSGKLFRKMGIGRGPSDGLQLFPVHFQETADDDLLSQRGKSIRYGRVKLLKNPVSQPGKTAYCYVRESSVGKRSGQKIFRRIGSLIRDQKKCFAVMAGKHIVPDFLIASAGLSRSRPSENKMKRHSAPRLLKIQETFPILYMSGGEKREKEKSCRTGF